MKIIYSYLLLGSRFIILQNFKLRGKIRDKNNKLVRGFKILAYDSDTFGRDDFLGESKTDSCGKFEIGFDDSQYNGFLEFDGRPDIYLEIYDRGGKRVIRTRIEKTKRDIEYQIILGAPKPDIDAPDIYSDNITRLFSMMDGVNEMLMREYRINLNAINSERIPQELKQRFKKFVDGHEQRQKNLENFTALLDGLVTSSLEQTNLGRIGYDGPHVPSRPRHEAHNHVIIWSSGESKRWELFLEH